MFEDEAVRWIEESKRIIEKPVEKLKTVFSQSKVIVERDMFRTSLANVSVYTDGSYISETNVATYGIVFFKEGVEILRLRGIIQNNAYKSSTGAELYAVLKALEVAGINHWGNIEINYDCTAIKGYLEFNETESSENLLKYNYFYHYQKLIKKGKLKICLKKIKGHSKLSGNDIAHDLAMKARIEGDSGL